MFRLFLIVSVLFVSCNFSNRDKAPDNLISEDQLIPLLVDLHIADGLLGTINIKKEKIKHNDFYFNVLKKHNTTKEIFDENFKYYTKNPKNLEKIYDKVLDELNKIQGDLAKTDTTNIKSKEIL